MDHANQAGTGDQFQSYTSLLRHTLSIALPMSLHCAAKLGIPDILHDYGSPMPLAKLATALHVPPTKMPALARLMRLLVSQGIFTSSTENAECFYSHNPISKILARDCENMSAFVLTLLDEVLVKPWHSLSEWMLAENPSYPFKMVYGGRTFWEVTQDRPELGSMVNEAMASNSRWVVRAVVERFPEAFQGLKSLIDVGGGNGSVATVISEAFPEVKCSVLDLPHVVNTVPDGGIITWVAGDMFEHVPQANAVLLKNVLHDWSDEQCVQILKRCKEAIPSNEEGGKIIIVDIIVDLSINGADVIEAHLLFDLTLMIGGDNGKERDEQEWRQIFLAAGFHKYKIFPMFSLYSLIELYP